MKDFTEVVDGEISNLKVTMEEIKAKLQDPNFHAGMLADSLGTVVPQIEGFSGTLEEFKVQVINMLATVPDTLVSNWSRAQGETVMIASDISKWQTMKSSYVDWVTENFNEEDFAEPEPEPSSSQPDLKTSAIDQYTEMSEKIKSGEVSEPSKMTAIRRPPGTRPPITLGSYRKIASGIKSGEESEA